MQAFEKTDFEEKSAKINIKIIYSIYFLSRLVMNYNHMFILFFFELIDIID